MDETTIGRVVLVVVMVLFAIAWGATNRILWEEYQGPGIVVQFWAGVLACLLLAAAFGLGVV